eukprot:SAG11_NODE_195_length_12838_cov_15.711045_5_plen_129_part_00
MEPQAENPQGPLLSDMPIEVVHRIGDFFKPFDKRRLGESIYKHGVGKQYLLGQTKIILDHAASKIQSVLKAPVYLGVGESQRKHNILFQNHPNPRMLRRLTQTPASRGRGIVVDKLGRPIDFNRNKFK